MYSVYTYGERESDKEHQLRRFFHRSLCVILDGILSPLFVCLSLFSLLPCLSFLRCSLLGIQTPSWATVPTNSLAATGPFSPCVHIHFNAKIKPTLWRSQVRVVCFFVSTCEFTLKVHNYVFFLSGNQTEHILDWLGLSSVLPRASLQHTQLHTHTHMDLPICLSIYLHVHVCGGVYIEIYIYMCEWIILRVSVYIYSCACLSIYLFICMYMYTHTRIQTYTHTHTLSLTHTHKHTRAQTASCGAMPTTTQTYAHTHTCTHTCMCTNTHSFT